VDSTPCSKTQSFDSETSHAMAAKHSVPMVPMTTLPLEGAGMEALCDALLRRLLPALEPLVEEAANRAAMLAVRMIWDVFFVKTCGWVVG